MTPIIPTSQAQSRLDAQSDSSKLFQKLTHTQPMPQYTQTNPIVKYIFIGFALWAIAGFITAANQDIGARNAKAQVRQDLSTTLGMPLENIKLETTLTPKLCDLATTADRCGMDKN